MGKPQRVRIWHFRTSLYPGLSARAVRATERGYDPPHPSIPSQVRVHGRGEWTFEAAAARFKAVLDEAFIYWSEQQRADASSAATAQGTARTDTESVAAGIDVESAAASFARASSRGEDLDSFSAPDGFNAVEFNWALLEHEAISNRLQAIGVCETEEPPSAWFHAYPLHGQLLWRLSGCLNGDTPDKEDTDIAFFRAEQHHAAPRKVVGNSFTEQFALVRNHKAGRRSVPRSTNPQHRLEAASTAQQLEELLETRLREFATARAEGTLGNAISKFNKYRHYTIEDGLRPFRWALFGAPSRETLSQESHHFFRFLVWASILWRSHEMVSQGWSAVCTIHRRVAGIEIPHFPKVSNLLKDMARRLNAEAGPPKEKEFLVNFEMNAIQELVVTFLEDVLKQLDDGKTVAPKTLRHAVWEAGCDLATSMVREHGSRPGQLLCSDANFNSKWGGLRSVRNLYWTKWNIAMLDKAPGDSAVWMKLPLDKCEFTRAKETQRELLQQKLFIYLDGDIGRFSVIAAAKRLARLDPVAHGEISVLEPAVRDPRHLGGTGKALNNGHYNAHIKAHAARVLSPGDKRLDGMTGYVVKRSSALAVRAAATEMEAEGASGGAGGQAGASAKEAHRVFLNHTAAKMGLRYDCPVAQHMATAAVRAANAKYTPVQHMAAGLEGSAIPLSEVLDQDSSALNDRVTGPLHRGWESSNLSATMAALRPDESRSISPEDLEKRMQKAMHHQVKAPTPPDARNLINEFLDAATDSEDGADREEEDDLQQSTQGTLRSSEVGGVDSSAPFIEAMAELGASSDPVWIPGTEGVMRLATPGPSRAMTVVPAACATMHPAVLRRAEAMTQCTVQQPPGAARWVRSCEIERRFAGDDEHQLQNPAPSSATACPARENGKWQLCNVLSAEKAGGGSVKVWTVSCGLQSGAIELHPAANIWDTRYEAHGRAVGGRHGKYVSFAPSPKASGAAQGEALQPAPDGEQHVGSAAAAGGPGPKGEEAELPLHGPEEALQPSAAAALSGEEGVPEHPSQMNSQQDEYEGSQSDDGAPEHLTQKSSQQDEYEGSQSDGPLSASESESESERSSLTSSQQSEAQGESESEAEDSSESRDGGTKRGFGQLIDDSAGCDGGGHDRELSQPPLNSQEREFFTSSDEDDPDQQEFRLGNIPRAAGNAERRRLAAVSEETILLQRHLVLPASQGRRAKRRRRAVEPVARAERASQPGAPRCPVCKKAFCECAEPQFSAMDFFSRFSAFRTSPAISDGRDEE